jgi:putative tricarboxylic transport membrane protein
MLTMEEGLRFEGLRARISPRDVFRTIGKLPRYWIALLRSAAIGCWMGITPGGPTAASFMSYGVAKRFSRRREDFGKGAPEGIISPETADHAAGTSAILPMLALGVPGSATAAVMMGGLMIWGLTPGPMLFLERPDFVWGLIASMYLGNVVAVVLVLATIPIFASILRIPFSIIGPVIVVVCFIGAYTVSSKEFDLWLALAFGVMGYAFKKLNYPIAPLVLAMVLGDKAEDAFRQSMIMSKGSLSIFWANGLVATLTAIGIVLLIMPLFGDLFRRLRPKPLSGGAAAR